MEQRQKAEVLRVLRHAGLFEAAERLEPVLPDVVDLDRDQDLLEGYGVSRDLLVSRLGGSP
jgi:hypothetical protein